MTDGDVVVVGAGIAGLGAALGLARRGIRVTVLDKDPPPTGIDNPESAFNWWDRRSVPQARQPHLFMGRATRALTELAPDAVTALVDWGIEESGLLMELLPEEARRPDDEALRSLVCRRLPFELALRKAAEADAGIRLWSPARLDAVHLDAAGIRAVSVDGVETPTRWVIDAGGRRSPVWQMLRTAGAALPDERAEECSLTYFTRHYRRTVPGPPLWTVMAVRADFGHLLVLGFPGDQNTFSIDLAAATAAVRELSSLRHLETWERVAQTLPNVVPWVDPSAAEPLTDVQVMAGQRNTLRDVSRDGQVVVPGWLPIGDALCTTNPVLALGASLALTHAGAAVDALTSSSTRAEATERFRAAVHGEAASWYEESAAGDRVRTARLLGHELDDADLAYEAKEQLLRLGVAAGARAGDADLLRAMMRRLHLFDGPDDWLDDADLVRRAREALARQTTAGTPTPGTSREDLLALMGA